MAEVLHRRWVRSVEAFVDGELTVDRSHAVLAHLRECPECGPHAALLLAVRASLVRGASRVPPLTPTQLRRLAAYGQGEGWAGGQG